MGIWVKLSNSVVARWYDKYYNHFLLRILLYSLWCVKPDSSNNLSLQEELCIRENSSLFVLICMYLLMLSGSVHDQVCVNAGVCVFKWCLLPYSVYAKNGIVCVDVLVHICVCVGIVSVLFVWRCSYVCGVC